MSEQDPYYRKLSELADQVCKDFSDEGHPHGDPYINVFRDSQYIDSNFPWLYVKFGYEGPLSLHALKEIEKRFQVFCATEGGSVETVHMSRRGPGFTVKMVYVPGKKKGPPETSEGPQVVS